MNGIIYQREGSRFFYVDYTLPNGKRRRESTGAETREEAEAFLAKIKEADRISRQGRNVRRRVLRLLSEIVEIHTGQQLKDYTARQWLSQWVKGKQFSKADSTGKRYGQAIDDFLASLGSKGDEPLEFLNTEDLRAFWKSERDTGKSKETVGLAVKVVRSALRQAHREGLIDVDPGASFETEANSFEQAEAEAFGIKEKETFTPEEVTALIEAADGPWKNMIRLAAFTGMRLGDCANLRWRNVDLAKMEITFMPRKTAYLKKPKVLTIPMHPELEAALSALPGADGSPEAFVFPDLAGKTSGGKSGLSMKFARIMGRAGVEAGLMREGEGEKGRDIRARSFHSFRHGYITSLEEIGASEEQRQKLAAHSSRDMTKRYTHIKTESLRPLVEKLPGFKAAGEEAAK